MKTLISQPIMFDPQRRAASAELRATVASLTAFLEQREADLKLRKRARREADRRSFRLAVEAIACNLAVMTLTDPERALAVPRSSGVMWAKGRCRNPVYGQHFLDALDLMARPEVRLIEVLTLGYKFKGGDKRQSTINPTAAFSSHVSPSLSSWEAFARADEPEVIILKGRKDRRTGRGEAIDYANTRETQRMRSEVRRINAYLSKAGIRL
jgi:hypothetical protein